MPDTSGNVEDEIVGDGNDPGRDIDESEKELHEQSVLELDLVVRRARTKKRMTHVSIAVR